MATASPEASAPFWRRLYRGWLEVAARFGEIQTLVIVTLSYLLAIGPMAIGAAVARRDLLDKRALRRDGSAWSDADSVAAPDRERARRMF